MPIRSPRLMRLALLALPAAGAAPAAAQPVDLSSWIAEGDGNWILQSDAVMNDSVLQTVNGGPAVFFNGMDSQGTALSGTLEVQTPDDDDFIGFVLGYDAGDLAGANPTTQYILLDWKQAPQEGWPAGMTLSRVTGPLDAPEPYTDSDAWDHVGAVEVLASAATLGSVGWQDNQEYAFDISFTATNIQVFIDDVLQFDIVGDFEDGSFGFYNLSQPNVRYAGLVEQDVPGAIPEPGTLALLGAGLAGLGIMRRRRRAG